MKVELADGDFYDIDVATDPGGSDELPGAAAVILDSASGWHNTYRLVDLAVDHGMVLSENDTDAVARYRASPEDGSGVPFEVVYELADKAETYLNSQLVTINWSFGWSDHQFLLANEVWWEHDA